VHLLLVDRRAEEVAVSAEGPAVVDAGVDLRVAGSSVDTRMPRCVHMFSITCTSPLLSRVISTESEPMSPRDEVARVRHLRSHGQEDPDATEDAFHLQLVDLGSDRVRICTSRVAGSQVGRYRGAIGQRGARGGQHGVSFTFEAGVRLN